MRKAAFLVLLFMPLASGQMVPMLDVDFDVCHPCGIMDVNQTREVNGVFTWIEHGSNGDAWTPPEQDIRVTLSRAGIGSAKWLDVQLEPEVLVVPHDAHGEATRYSAEGADVVFTWTTPVTITVTRIGGPANIGDLADRDGIVHVYAKAESDETELYRNGFGIGSISFDAYTDDAILAAAVKHLESSDQANATQKLQDLGWQGEEGAEATSDAPPPSDENRAIPWWPFVLLLGLGTAGVLAWIGRRR